ncbi:MAG TPA: 3-methyl-2-oxobutanoate hydroxymethyltransferase, partial [Longimicrobiaceae bacterium]|nr:3-methyl-2-oxobutanoate hydroxymethyltransferase [Longimicrobiaceae bacterium]
RNAGRVLKETDATAVKLEGGSEAIAGTVEAMVSIGIPVMGHLGFTPQSVRTLGGNRVQGRDDAGRERLQVEARRLEDAGAFSLVLEMVPSPLASTLSQALRIPTIGIGAGGGCDGQVLVLPDMLGLNPDFKPRFLRHFGDIGEQVDAALHAYVDAVKSGEYPAEEHTFE